MRVSVSCPACGVAMKRLVVSGRTRALCPACEGLFEVACAACGAMPSPAVLTGDEAAPRCEACDAPLELTATPVLDRGRVAVGEPSWDGLVLEEGGGDAPYRDGRPTRLSVRRAPGRWKQLATVWAAVSAPGAVLAGLGMLGPGLGWAAMAAGLVSLSVSPIVSLEVSPDGVHVARRLSWPPTRRLRHDRIRKIAWAGRGGRCHVYAETVERDVELLFDGLTPAQAEALEGKIARLLDL